MTCEQPPWLQHLACEPEATCGAPPRHRRLFGVDLFLSLSFWPVSGRFGAPGACPAASGLRVLPGVPWEGTRRATQRHDGTRINLREACRQSLDPYVLYVRRIQVSGIITLHFYVRIQVSGIITLHFYVNVRILYKSQVLLLYTYVNII